MCCGLKSEEDLSPLMTEGSDFTNEVCLTDLDSKIHDFVS